MVTFTWKCYFPVSLFGMLNKFRKCGPTNIKSLSQVTANNSGMVNLMLICFLFLFTGLTCTLGKIHLAENSLFLLVLKNVLSSLRTLSLWKMRFLSCNQSCQCVRYYLNTICIYIIVFLSFFKW